MCSVAHSEYTYKFPLSIILSPSYCSNLLKLCGIPCCYNYNTGCRSIGLRAPTNWNINTGVVGRLGVISSDYSLIFIANL